MNTFLFRLAVFTTLFMTLSTLPALACLNDQDTLADEARARPDALRAITGRFERNPPLYYQMRIDRESKEIEANPRLLDKYDDVAVAYDRIAEDDNAIAWIEKKHAHLPPYNPHNAVLKEQWYRYYANAGTFWVHRWARRGAHLSTIGDVKTARGLIARAIAIKPGAHFGREKYQLKVMDWIINPKGQSLADALQNDPPAEASTALSGLVELGNAWQSFDVFYALSEILKSDEGSTHALGTLAAFRADEIHRSGGISMHPEVLSPDTYDELLRGEYTQDFVDDYHKLRAEADDWEAKRTAYMMARLTRGDHPDTDPQFWAGFHDYGPPKIVPGYVMAWQQRENMENLEWITLFSVFVVAALWSGAIIVVRRVRSKPVSESCP
ncbi:MAG: hypothetical protein ACLQVD_07540 [Capsulimonadaceae bacterium]